MSTQSRLENIAISKRDSLELMNEYQDIAGKEYNEGHKDALSDGDDANGKGNRIPLGYATADPSSFIINPDGTRTQKINYSSIITHENGTSAIGNIYDRKGHPSIPKSGREGLETINKYSAGNEYSASCVDMTANLLKGQYEDKRY
jgi:hypothetical protein